jgi:hypothetical protein
MTNLEQHELDTAIRRIATKAFADRFGTPMAEAAQKNLIRLGKKKNRGGWTYQHYYMSRKGWINFANVNVIGREASLQE